MSKPLPMARLSDVLKKSEEMVYILPENRYKQVTVQLWGKGVALRNEVNGSEIAAKRRTIVHSQQFILSRIDARNGAFGIVPDSLEEGVVSNDFPVFNLNSSRVIPGYLGWMCKTKEFIDICKVASEGTTNRVRLKVDEFLESEVPLPDINEQRRIVARIEELAARIEEARELRRRAVEEAEALKISAKDFFLSGHFSRQWPMVSLGEVADIRAGVTLGRLLNGSTIKLPYLRVANVQDGYLDLSKIKEIEILGSELEKWQLQKGDLLLTEGGDWDKLGRGAVWNNEISNCIHQNHIFRLRVNLNDFNPEYLCALIGSSYGKEYFQVASKQTTNLASINQRQLKAFQVFKPPLQKQNKIITHLKDLDAKLDALKRHQSETAAELDALLPAVLERAFRGEL